MNITVVVQTDDADGAAHALASAVEDWDCDVPIRPASPDDQEEQARKVVDPVALISLIMSIPSAALAVRDLADRIRKRRRADRLIQQAKALRSVNGTRAYLLVDGRSVTLDTMSADELLDLATKGGDSTVP